MKIVPQKGKNKRSQLGGGEEDGTSNIHLITSPPCYEHINTNQAF